MKCKWCGKEFNNTDQRVYCSHECKYKHDTARGNLVKKLQKLAIKNHTPTSSNFTKIVNAKMMLFKGKDLMKCPCDADNPDRYCGSVLCAADIIKNGKCHCGLFLLTSSKKDV
ncbi:MAG: hypothetical protein II453_14555 [Alphaproteobacteria bacterium]|nr:hypothetical protein [Alphaproteobacteria bacterium]